MKLYFITSSVEDTPKQELLDSLESLGEAVVIRHEGKLSELEQLKQDQDEKILAVDPGVFGWDLDAQSLTDIPNVKAVCTSSTSFDWIKPNELKEMGVLGCNVPGFSTDSVAEYALVMAIETARGVPLMTKNGGKYDFENTHSILLKGKTAGIIGLGRIGTRMAELCQGIGMNVVYWSRKSRDDRFEYVELDDLFQRSDLVVPALVENKETEKLITRERLDMMSKSTVMVGINRVRSLWDEEYVLAKVKNKEILGYAFDGENSGSMSDYEGNVLAIPAMIWFTKDSLENLMEIWVENVKKLAEGSPQNIIN